MDAPTTYIGFPSTIESIATTAKVFGLTTHTIEAPFFFHGIELVGTQSQYNRIASIHRVPETTNTTSTRMTGMPAFRHANPGSHSLPMTPISKPFLSTTTEECYDPLLNITYASLNEHAKRIITDKTKHIIAPVRVIDHMVATFNPPEVFKAKIEGFDDLAACVLKINDDKWISIVQRYRFML